MKPAMLPVDPCDNFRARNPQRLFVSDTKVFPTQLYVFHLKLSWMYIHRCAYIVKSHKVRDISHLYETHCPISSITLRAQCQIRSLTCGRQVL